MSTPIQLLNLEDELTKQAYDRMREATKRAMLAAQVAIGAIDRLMPVLQGRSGQSFRVRGILWSLYNGKAYSWLEIVHLDRAIKEDLAALMLGWGCPGCFYDELKAAVTAAGQWQWFTAESDYQGSE